MGRLPRRTLLKSGAGLLVPALWPAALRAASPAKEPGGPDPTAGGLHDLYPTQDPQMVREMVGASHFDLAKVTRLVEAHPALARASWDWGFGDWETALGAASHTGQREIARLLISRGAPPTLFSAAMLGQLEVVKSIVAAAPGVERSKGPHGIPLLAHAKVGGEQAAAVLAYLESLPRPEEADPIKPLSEEETGMLPGVYRFGAGERDRFKVDVVDHRLGLERPGGSRRLLFHLGGFEFHPAGVESVRIKFSVSGGRASGLTIQDGGPPLKALRI